MSDDQKKQEEEVYEQELSLDDLDAIAGGAGGDDEDGGKTVFGPKMWQAIFLLNRAARKNQQ